MRYKHDLSEQWGCVVTVHQVFRCQDCGENWVRSGHFSVETNGKPNGLTKDSITDWGELQVAAEWVR